MIKANIHTIAHPGDMNLILYATDSDFYTKEFLQEDYEPLYEYLQNINKEIEVYDCNIKELKQYMHEYVEFKINKNSKVKHGDIFWLPSWGYHSRPEYGIHHIIEDELGYKRLISDGEGCPIGEPRDYPGVSYNEIYKDINLIIGKSITFKNQWYYW